MIKVLIFDLTFDIAGCVDVSFNVIHVGYVIATVSLDLRHQSGQSTMRLFIHYRLRRVRVVWNSKILQDFTLTKTHFGQPFQPPEYAEFYDRKHKIKPDLWPKYEPCYFCNFQLPSLGWIQYKRRLSWLPVRVKFLPFLRLPLVQKRRQSMCSNWQCEIKKLGEVRWKNFVILMPLVPGQLIGILLISFVITSLFHKSFSVHDEAKPSNFCIKFGPILGQ